MAIEVISGAIGQIKGPFTQNQSFTFSGAPLKLGISIGEKDLMLLDFPPYDFHFTINGERINMKYAFNEENKEQFLVSKSCLYETERETPITSISFPVGAPASTIIEYSIQTIGS